MIDSKSFKKTKTAIVRHFLRIDSNDDSIEDFLGNEIFNRDYVYNKKKRMTKNGLPLDVLELDNAIKTITTTRTLPLALMDGLTEVPTCFGIYFASL